MEWIPVVFIAFKLSIVAAAVFFSIKSHHAKEKEEREEERQRQARPARRDSPIQHGLAQQRVEAAQCARPSGPG